MISNLKELKDTFDAARKALAMNREPIEDLLKLNGCLKAIVEQPSLLFNKEDDEKGEYKKFFFEEMTFGALKRLSIEKSRDEKVSTSATSLATPCGRELFNKAKTS
jgi:hypothetical protein